MKKDTDRSQCPFPSHFMLFSLLPCNLFPEQKHLSKADYLQPKWYVRSRHTPVHRALRYAKLKKVQTKGYFFSSSAFFLIKLYSIYLFRLFMCVQRRGMQSDMIKQIQPSSKEGNYFRINFNTIKREYSNRPFFYLDPDIF